MKVNSTPSYNSGTRIPLTEQEKNYIRDEWKARSPELVKQLLPMFNNALLKSKEAQKMREEAKKMREEGEKLCEEGEKLCEQAKKGSRDLLTKQFYSIFNAKKTLPLEKIETIFNNYIADGSLSVESSEGASYPKINSMKTVIKYLNENPKVIACDFRSFKTEVYDIPSLANYLKESSVKAIALNQNIPENAKLSLADAITARKGGLKIQYFA